MMTATNPTDRRNRDYERIFVGNRCINVAHFYSIGSAPEHEEIELFAVGYWTHDGHFVTGTVAYDGEDFSLIRN